MSYLRWLKSKYPQWHERGVINLAGSGIKSADSTLLKHAGEHRNRIEALLERDYDAQYGQHEFREHIRLRYALPAELGILPSFGTSSALTLVYQSMLRGEPRGRVLVESPAYDPLVQIPQYLGAGVDRFARQPKHQYAPDLSEIGARITPQTRLVVLTNLHNPSGQSVSLASLEELARVVAKANPRTRILVDETFAGFLGPAYRPAAALGPQFISLSSLTKVYGLGPLRTGWIVASGETFELLKEAWLQMQNIGSRLAEAMACVVFENIQQYEHHWQTTLEANRPMVRSWLDTMKDRIEADFPSQGCLCFPRPRGIDVDSLFSLAESKFDVVIAPGRFFDAPAHFRLGFGGETNALKQGLDRLADAIKAAAG